MRQNRLIALVLLLTACASSSVARRPQSDPQTLRSATLQLTDIFRPHVKALDRDIWTFRYEARTTSFHPLNQSDVQNRIGPWALRFFNPDVVSGADVGPGVYVATDPVATATWGLTDPQMYAIKLKTGARILVGDVPELSDLEIKGLNQALKNLNCLGEKGPVTKSTTLGEVTGMLRYTPEAECRKVAIEIFSSLKIQALTYTFNSVSLKDCRVTGTAFSIIDPAAVAMEEINYYNSQKSIQGSRVASPFIKALFREAQNDYYSQSLLADPATLAKFKNAFGFFDQVQSVKPTAYNSWKAKHIFKCGERSTAEGQSDIHHFLNLTSERPDLGLQDLLIQTAVTYRALIAQLPSVQSIGAEFEPENLKALIEAEFVGSGLKVGDRNRWEKERAHQAATGFRGMDQALQSVRPGAGTGAELIIKLTTDSKGDPMKSLIRTNAMLTWRGFAPILDSDPGKSRELYIALLKRCLGVYQDKSQTEQTLAAGDCAVAPRN